MKTITNISPFLFAFITLAFVSLIVISPIDIVLIKLSFSDFQSEFIGLIIKMTTIFAISYYLIKKLKIESITGISSNYAWKFKYLNLIPVYLMILGILSIISKDLSQIYIGNLVLLLLACLAVGFAEEFLFRGLLQSLFSKKYHSRKNGILISTLIPAIVFGLFHLINLTKNENVLAVLVQVVFATFIGFFFGVILLKTNKITPIAITHGLINFFFSLTFLPGIKTFEEAELSIAPIILTLPLLIIGLFTIKKIKKEELIEKLHQSFE